MFSKPVTCSHLFENFLPVRQAYIYELLGQLNHYGIGNIAWSYKASNLNLFPYPMLRSFGSENFVGRNRVRLEARLKGHRSYLTDFLKADPSESNLLHGHFLWMSTSVSELKKKLRVPACITSYGEDEVFRAGVSGRVPPTLEDAGKSADIIFTTSNYLYGILKRLIGGDRLRLWHIGVDLDSYPTVRHSEKAAPEVLSVGRLIERKGYSFLVRAIPEVLKEVPGARFRIIGEGPEQDRLQRLARDLKVDGSLEFIPPQPSLKEFYASADLFVLPSILLPDGVTEGLGVPLIEASACSLPVVASEVGGIRDAVENRKTGYLVRQSDYSDLASRISRLLLDPSLRQEFGDEGRKKIAKEFDLATQARTMATWYASLLGA